ncbi:hypothetical protein [Agaribacterium sp. ZY112]|uniref:hypothetical protein n=1 Tax=Agaribacterium sp. ZY112 TaxID=3233574 RepID=UPI003525385D
MTILQDLRNDPEGVSKHNDFFVDVRGFRTTPEGNNRCEVGGPVTLKESIENNVNRLTIKNDGSDYFFPWVNRGVGEVSVPINQPNGTIVTTGGMNGCALQVNRDGDNIIFYHDADNRYLGNLKQPQGQQLCRVEPSLYMKIPYGQTIVEENPRAGLAYLYQLICIRHNNKWKVTYSGIILGPGINMPIKRTFTPGVSKFLTSFSE